MSTLSRSLICGVDPGFTGAISFYNFKTKELERVQDMPTSPTQKINLALLATTIDHFATDTLLAVIEEVGPRPKEGVSSVFRFGYGAGVVAGVIAANYIPIRFVAPGTWKILMGLTRDKGASIGLARTKFPKSADSFKRQKDHGRAEASLLALFGAERLVGK